MDNKIMLIDSERLIGLMVAKRMKSCGYSVCELQSSGEEALKVIPQEAPDLVVMDVLLSGDLDGIESAGIIKRRYGIPIIFFTGYQDKKTIQRAWEVKPIAILDKFVPFSELKAAIDLVF